MGELAHLGGPEVGLATHVKDVVAVLELEDLHDVILCAHSYGGMPATGAADRVSARIRLLVYVDALAPSDGQSAFDLLPDEFVDLARAAADEHGDGWRVTIPAALLPPEGLIAEDERARYVSRLGDQPLASFSEPINLSGTLDRLPHAFVRCTGASLGHDLGGDPIAPMAARAQREGWLYRELVAPHDPQLSDPLGTAAVLAELAAA